jgi:hypothetical protein
MYTELEAATILPALVMVFTGTMTLFWLVATLREGDAWERGVCVLRLCTYTPSLVVLVAFVLSPLLPAMTEEDVVGQMHTVMSYLSGSGFLAIADFQGDVTLFGELSVLCGTASVYSAALWGAPQRPRSFPFGLIVCPMLIQYLIASRVGDDDCLEWNWRRVAGTVMLLSSWCFLLLYWEQDKGPADTAWTSCWTLGFWFGLCTLVVFAPRSEIAF